MGPRLHLIGSKSNLNHYAVGSIASAQLSTQMMVGVVVSIRRPPGRWVRLSSAAGVSLPFFYTACVFSNTNLAHFVMYVCGSLDRQFVGPT